MNETVTLTIEEARKIQRALTQGFWLAKDSGKNEKSLEAAMDFMAIKINESKIAS